MLRSRLGVMASVICMACAVCRAEPAADVLGQCRKACGALSAQIILERNAGTWQASCVYVYTGKLRDSDLQPLVALTTLESLQVRVPKGSNYGLTVEGIERLRDLPRLQRLGLHGRLRDGCMEAIGSLRQLEDLDLLACEGIKDKDLLHLRGLLRLRRLNLGALPLTDEGLACIGTLQSVEELGLRYVSGLTDNGLTRLKGLKNLRSLDLSDTEITEAGLPVLKDLKTLRSLDLRGLRVTGTGASVLMALPHLEELNLSFYGDRDEAGLEPVDLSSWDRLRSLEIDRCSDGKVNSSRVPHKLQRLKLPGIMAETFNRQPPPQSLESVHVFLGPGLAGDLTWLHMLPNLRELCLDDLDASMTKWIEGLRSLRALTVTGCHPMVDEEGMRRIGQLPQLESLEFIVFSDMTDTGMDALSHLMQLQRLKLTGIENVSDKGFACLRELKRLRALSLEFEYPPPRSVDGMLSHVQALGELEELALHGATLTDDDLKKLADLKKLRRLDLTDSHGYTDGGLWALMQALPNLQEVRRSYRPVEVVQRD